MNQLKFSTNWNNKLHCNVFSTIRLNSSKYNVGEQFEVLLQHKEGSILIGKTKYKSLGTATVLQHSTVQVCKLPNGLCLLDTGYNANETKSIILKMYQNIKGFGLQSLLSVAILKFNHPKTSNL